MMIKKMDASQLDEQTQQLMAARLDPPDFYTRLLAAICNTVGGTGGVAWGCRQEPYREICHFHVDEAKAIRLSCTAQEHSQLLEAACTQAESKLAFPRQAEDIAEDELAPVILMCPILISGTTRTVLELFLPPGGTDQEYQDVVRTVIAVSESVTEYEKTRDVVIREAQENLARQSAQQQAIARQQAAAQAEQQRFGAPEQFTGQPGPVVGPVGQVQGSFDLQGSAAASNLNGKIDVDAFADQIHSSLDWKETAAHVANEARRVLQCDRVSVIQFRRNKAKTAAVSGQPSVNRRSNTVRGLERVASNVLRIGDELWYPADEQLPPQIDKALEKYFLESVAKSMAVIPLMDRRPKPDPEDERKARPPRVFGGLVVEYLNESVEERVVMPQIDTIARHSENALRNANNHRSMFLFGLWNLLGKSKVVTTMRNIPIALAVVAAIVAITLALIFVPAEFKITSNGNLVPIEREDVFAHTDGTVRKINVGHESKVHPEMTLLELENKDLELRLQQVTGEIQQNEDSLKTISTALLSGQNGGQAAQDIQQLRLQKNRTESQLASLNKQLSILQDEQKKLSVVANQSGTIMTWNVKELFKDRPVRQGELLLEIANLEGKWQLELDLPDRRIGHVLNAQREIDEELKVTFVLASDPGTRFKGHITEISRKTEVDPEKGQTIRVTVAIDSDDIPFLQNSTGVTAKIHCGERSLGYVWLHDVFEFVQAKVLFHIQ